MEGDCGPGIAAQLALEPFAQVIGCKPRFGMLVIHTSAAEIYGRLWCVFEINEAIQADTEPVGAMSMTYLASKIAEKRETGRTYKRICGCDTERASCCSKEDEGMIRRTILAGEGYGKLNDTISTFRQASLERMHKTVACYVLYKRIAHRVTHNCPEEQILRMLSKIVEDCAAVFVGLHCLYTFARDHENEDYMGRVFQCARWCVWRCGDDGPFWTMDIEGETPPGFDPEKRCEDRMKDIIFDDDFLKAVLLDINNWPQPLGWLELYAGGSDYWQA